MGTPVPAAFTAITAEVGFIELFAGIALVIAATILALGGYFVFTRRDAIFAPDQPDQRSNFAPRDPLLCDSPIAESDELMVSDAGGPALGSTPIPGSPSDNTTVTAVVAGMVSEGYDANFMVNEGGHVTCGACGVAVAASTLDLDAFRRLEGASDPDDMVAVTAVRCPVCRSGGTMVLGVGPAASGEDSDVVADMPSSSPQW